jgi:hypothetical protein
MRRAAALAIALVAILLVLMSRPRGSERSTDRQAPARPDEAPAASAREAPEPVQDTRNIERTAPEAIADGLVLDRKGEPVAGYMVFAIPRDEEKLWDMDDPHLPRGDAPDVPSTSTDARGAFAFRSLAPGDYRLALGEGWTPEAPVTFRHDTRRLRVVAARAWTAEVVALDLGTSEPLPRFLVRYRWPSYAREERTGEGNDGVFRTRLSSGVGTDLLGRVEAEGYHTGHAHIWSGQEPARRNVWLAREDEPRLVLRVQFDDGAPCDEEASVFVQHRAERRNSILPAVRDGGGRYRVAVPPGSWLVDFRPAHSHLFREECCAEVHLRTGERAEVFLKLARGGHIVVRRPAGDASWTLGVTAPSSETISMVDIAASHELRHLKPGRYVLNAWAAPSTAESLPRVWRRIVDVTTGSRQELTIE